MGTFGEFMITELTIQNFKQFTDPLTVKLDPLTILIGQNNSGKSTVMQGQIGRAHV